METSNFISLRESRVGSEASELEQRFAEDGYVFTRGAIEREKIERVRDRIVEELKLHGLVTADVVSSAPTWSGKSPDADEVLPEGPIISAIAETGMLSQLSSAPELIELLEKTLGGDVFRWKDADARMRIILEDQISREGGAEGPKFSFAVPPHQDYFFFRPIKFCIVWIPLMDIDESVGGLTVREGAHKEGLHETWWKGKEFLGVASSPAERLEWQEAGAVAVAGTTRASVEDEEKSWLRSDYRVGDAIIVDALMMHAGVPNRSNRVRLSADFRYQRKGTPTHWESYKPMEYAANYFSSVLAYLDELQVTPGLYERVWEQMRLTGPDEENGDDIPTRVRGLVEVLDN